MWLQDSELKSWLSTYCLFCWFNKGRGPWAPGGAFFGAALCW